MRSRQYQNKIRRIAAIALALILLATTVGTAVAMAADAAERSLSYAVNPGNGTLREIDAELSEAISEFLTAPVNVRVKSAENADAPNMLTVSYGKDSYLAVWLAQDEATRQAFVAKNGYDDCKVFAQVDWAIDDPKKWNYSDKWDSDTGCVYIDEEHPNEYALGEWAYIDSPCTTAIADSQDIFLEFGNPKDENDIHWNNGKNGDYSIGWSSVLKQSQYTVVKVDSADSGNSGDNGTGEGNQSGDGAESKTGDGDNDNENDVDTAVYRVSIDMEQHTVYVRVRFGLALIKNEENSQQGDAGDSGNTGDNGNTGDTGNTGDADNGNTDNADNGNTDNADNGNTNDNGNPDDNGNPGENGENGNGGITVTKVYAFSEWSRTAAFGKDAGDPMYRLDEFFTAPEFDKVSFLEADENGFGPYMNYNLVVSEATVEAAKTIEENGGYVKLILEARHLGETEWVELTDYRDVIEGEDRVLLTDLNYGENPELDGKPLELRASYYIYGNDQTEYSSALSDIITCVVDADGNPVVTPEATPTITVAPRSASELKELLSATVEKPGDNHCKLCGVCPVQPLGICLFVWIGGVIIFLVIIILVAKGRSERRRKPAKRRK